MHLLIFSNDGIYLPCAFPTAPPSGPIGGDTTDHLIFKEQHEDEANHSMDDTNLSDEVGSINRSESEARETTRKTSS